MREFIGSLAGAAMLTALAALVHLDMFWKWVLWISALILALCSIWFFIDMVPQKRNALLIGGMIAGIVLVVGCALAIYLGLPKEKNPDKFGIFEPFRQLHDINPGLGSPLTHEEVDSAYFATYEQGLVIYLSSSNTHYVLPRDQTNKNVVISRVIDILPHESPYFKDEFTQRRLKIPTSKSPPVGGIAVEWEKNPKQWEWLGGREWQLIVDGVHAQYFENGIIFGPFPISYNIIYGTRIFSVIYSTNK
jgi:hypothetical protein